MRRLSRLAGAAIVCVLAVAACSGGAQTESPAEGAAVPSAAASEEPVDTIPPTPTPEPPPENAIRVGVLMDVGNLSAEDFDAGNVMSPLDRQPAIAFEAAINSLNEAGGLLDRPVSIISVDTTSRLSVIDKAASEMIEDGVQLIVITCELDFATPAIERAEGAGVLVMSPCASERGWASGAAGPLAFSMVPSADAYGRAMADYAWEQGHREMGVVTDATAPEARVECDAFTDRWRELGGTFGFREGFSLRSAQLLDENPRVAEMRAMQAVTLCAFPTIGLELLVGLRKLGIDAPIYGSPSLDSGTWLPIDIAQDSSGAADIGDFRMFTLASVGGDDPSPRLDEAISGYVSLQATSPSSGRFVAGADLADLWIQAVTEAGTTEGSDVARTLRSFRDVETVSGRISFDGAQAPAARQLRVLRVSNGQFVFEGLVTAATS